ncbi:ROK family protein [Actinotalea sp. K2]|uniref:ROK family protein n=1 Tax=Actinotalea sp. K2 TaxID=2939438 RepID=UPI0020179AAA|nr:ROK family protein [Actinotalea sp. K2]MCL3863306.1 ROK family protein [Actinotalea sp. K2]
MIVKKANTALVVNAVRSAGTMTIEEMATGTGLSRPTVVSIVRALESQRIIYRSGLAPAEVGRQPNLYAIDVTARFAIGIDIDGPPARLVLTDLTGAARHEAVWRLDNDATYEEILATLVHQVEQALRTAAINPQQVMGIGLGLPASVDVSSNRAVNLSRLEALRDAPIGEALHERTQIPVSVRNDAHLMALAEDSDKQEDYLYIAFRTGVGLAVVIDEKVFEGQTGNAGFIGHTTISPTGPLCACGMRGCLEAIVSKRAIVANYASAAGVDAPYDTILDLALHDGDHALLVLDDAARWFGLAIANLIKITDVYTVILGDLGCDETHPFFTAIAEAVAVNTATFLRRPPRLRAGRLSGAQFALGGAEFIIDQFFATPRLRLKADGG